MNDSSLELYIVNMQVLVDAYLPYVQNNAYPFHKGFY